MVDSMTLLEVWHGRKPAVHHLRTFECIMYVRNTTPHLKKLEDGGRKMIFIGYESDSKAYHAYDPIMKRAHVTRDVVFDEHWGSGSNDGKPDGTDEAPTTDGTDEAPIEESPLPAGVGDAEVDDNDKNLDANHDDDDRFASTS
jgi:hypothetical protein